MRARDQPETTRARGRKESQGFPMREAQRKGPRQQRSLAENKLRRRLGRSTVRTLERLALSTISGDEQCVCVYVKEEEENLTHQVV